MYKLRVCGADPEFWSKPFWHNFLKYIQSVAIIPNDIPSVRKSMIEELQKIDASDIPESGYIEFESEEDATAFVLKWS